MPATAAVEIKVNTANAMMAMSAALWSWTTTTAAAAVRVHGCSMTPRMGAVAGFSRSIRGKSPARTLGTRGCVPATPLADAYTYEAHTEEDLDKIDHRVAPARSHRVVAADEIAGSEDDNQ